ncbi:hypothetical protein OGAPHI_007281 [Ogataea philodendri]|uniref:Uncharacterized protein n=1 Tax=Ogataea philodendri TaxID=1378263 RepID=A0A9P8SZ62_9ASCO|nr:uncharacterized protein OGAPHI_007281 [Ogataea philodendri]KAH3660076.1 hypothetical protein OGAPHI_007281 [Ogataea philodendri]
MSKPLSLHATNRGSTSLGCEKTNVVTRSKLPKSHEDTVENGEAGNVLLQSWKSTCHGETKDGLEKHTGHQGESWTNVVGHKSTGKCTRHVEQVEHNVPSESLVEVTIRNNDVQDCGGVDTESQEQRQRWDGSESKSNSPNGLEVVRLEDPKTNHRNECGNDETKVNHGVGEPREVSVSVASRKQCRSLGTGSRTGWILGTNEDTKEKSVSS